MAVFYSKVEILEPVNFSGNKFGSHFDQMKIHGKHVSIILCGEEPLFQCVTKVSH